MFVFPSFSNNYRSEYSAWVAVDVEFFSSTLHFGWVISKVDLGTYLALSSVFSQLFGEGHWILRIAGDYSVDHYFPASRAKFLVGLFNGYDSHSTELLNHLVRIDADTDTARKGEVLDQSAV